MRNWIYRSMAVLALLLTAGVTSGCGGLVESVTGGCSGGSTVIVVDDTPSTAGSAGFKLDQVGAAVDSALEHCDELHVVTFGSTAQELRLAGLPASVPGRNDSTRDRRRPILADAVVDRVRAVVTDKAEPAAGSDLVGAIRFVASTYFSGVEGDRRLVLVTDGLSTRPDLNTPATVEDPEGARRALSEAGMGSVRLRGLEVVAVGLGHADATSPMPRPMVDALLAVWNSALRDTGARVRVLEALPGSAGFADELHRRSEGAKVEDRQAVAGAAGREHGLGLVGGAPAAAGTMLGGVAWLPRRRRRRNASGAGTVGATPWWAAPPDRTTEMAAVVAADADRGSRDSLPHELDSIGFLGMLQRLVERARLARRTRRAAERLAAIEPVARVELTQLVDAAVSAACAELELWAARLAAAGREVRHLSPRAAHLIEAALVLLDVWALGVAVSIGADLSTLDGLLLAGGGALGMVLSMRAVAVSMARRYHVRRLTGVAGGGATSDETAPGGDPTLRYWAGELTEPPLGRAGGALVGILAFLLVVTSVVVGVVRGQEGGAGLMAVMVMLTLLTLTGTFAVEWMAANPIADLVHAADRSSRRAARDARRAAGWRRSRHLRRARKLVSRMAAQGERSAAVQGAHAARTGATWSTRLAAGALMPATSGAGSDSSAEAPPEPIPSRELGDDRAAAGTASPQELLEYGFARAKAYAASISVLGSDRSGAVDQAVDRYRQILLARLGSAGIVSDLSEVDGSESGTDDAEAPDVDADTAGDDDADSEGADVAVDLSAVEASPVATNGSEVP